MTLLRTCRHTAFFAVAFLLILPYTPLRAQQFSWAQSWESTGSGGGAPYKITHDSSGKIYMAGLYIGTFDVDPSANISNLTAVGQSAMYVAKEDVNGNLLWAKAIQAKSSVNVGFVSIASIHLDSEQNIYVAGVFRDTVDFDPGPGTYYLQAPISNVQNFNIFVLKLSPLGDFIWAKQIGGAAGVVTSVFDFDLRGEHIYLIGATNGVIDADPGPAVVNINIPGTNMGILEKLDTAGNFVWAKTGIFGGKIKIDPVNDLVFNGQFNGTLDFDPGPGVFNFTSAGNSDLFFLKLDSAGNFLWAKQIGGSGFDKMEGLAVDRLGNIGATGYYEYGVDFDPGPGVFTLIANGRDMFNIRLRPNGDFSWATSLHPAGNDRGLGVAFDSVGSLLTCGENGNGADFDPGPASFILQNATSYIQKLDSSGNFIWARGWSADRAYSIMLDQEERIYSIGAFSGTVDFDPGPDTFLVSGSGQSATYLLKLCQQTDTVSLIADTTTACDGDTILLHAPVIAGATYRWYRNYILLPDTTHTIAATLFGDYRVRIGGGSCPSFGYKTLNFYPTGNPTISLPTTPLAATTGQQVSLNATVVNGGPAYVIDWYQNGILIATTNTDTTSYTKAPGTDTIIAVIRYPVPTNCYANDTSAMLLVTEIAGVEAVAAQMGVSLYPNPTTGLFTITAAEPIEQIDIRDVRGKLVYEASPQRLQTSVNLSPQGSGVYFYRLKVGDSWVRGKIVVQ